ncbi:ferrodoxin reductase-like protein, putative [Theileria equi strain WA]|uniref:Ferrodoxin reductase-like protein, putative n=1 Tax=Theileria equi strain WA TaxID=1537102 RepID=L1LCX0_THEEQ|nr:ferrodoxin reductase-like protein, putative [Theileria equi strain WA]EKX73257.1 ferrodoxin reductase-like protein, putative [Theileria equi strain WA]|eukprot:XP_004832709.1 ferrodoxin reductase-like protein, putative [Theileria equi strain WA]
MRLIGRRFFATLRLSPALASRRTQYLSSSYLSGRGKAGSYSSQAFGISASLTFAYACYSSLKSQSFCDGFEKVELGKLVDFQDGESYEVKIRGGKDMVLVSKVRGKLYCTGYACPHSAAAFINGGLTDECLVCPWHNAKFSIEDGTCLNGPCFTGLPTYKVLEEDGKLYAFLPPYPLPASVEMPKEKLSERDSRVFVICGGGAAAHSAAETLRSKGFTGRVLIYSDEVHLPYYRPHLTKSFHESYDKVPTDQALRPLSFYKDNKIEFYGGKAVKTIDTKNNLITLDDGTTVKYDKVLVATGSLSVKLPMTNGMTLTNHFTVRTVDDMKHLAASVKPDQDVVIVGANFIGCELASALKPSGAKLTVLTNMETPMENIIGKRAGSVIGKLLTDNGVKFLPHAAVKEYKIKGSKITDVVLGDGTVLKADCVVEGVGAKVDASLLPTAQLAKNGTIRVDESFRCLGCPDNVFAAGDVVSYPYHLNGDEISIKHWNVALQHGRVAASNMLDKPAKMTMVPFFWSNFFKKGFRFAGVVDGTEEILHEGDVDNLKFVTYYIKDKNIVAMMTMGMDKVGAAMTEAFDKKCLPSYAALKMGAANSQHILDCMHKLRS